MTEPKRFIILRAQNPPKVVITSFNPLTARETNKGLWSVSRPRQKRGNDIVSRVLPTSPAYPEATVTPAPRLQPRVFLKRWRRGLRFGWWRSWRLFRWQIFSLLLIAAFGLAGQWEFYLAQQEKGHKVFKQSGLFCGALLFLTSWFFLIEHPSQRDCCLSGWSWYSR